MRPPFSCYITYVLGTGHCQHLVENVTYMVYLILDIEIKVPLVVLLSNIGRIGLLIQMATCQQRNSRSIQGDTLKQRIMQTL